MATKHERKYEPKFFRRIQNEPAPDPADYLEPTKARLIASAVFCEIMGERLKELTYSICGRAMIPDAAGGLMDTPIDSAVISLYCKTKTLSARNFCFTLDQFPVTRPQIWTTFASNDFDESGRLPQEQAWKRKESFSRAVATAVFRTDNGRTTIFQETENRAIWNRETGSEVVSDSPIHDVKKIDEVFGQGPALTTHWRKVGGEMVITHQRLVNGEVKTFDGPGPTESFPGHTFDPIGQVYVQNLKNQGGIYTEEKKDGWNSKAPAVFDSIVYVLDDLIGNIIYDIAYDFSSGFRFAGAWSVESLFNALESRVDALGTVMERVRGSIDDSLAWFIGRNAAEVPDDLNELEYCKSLVAPILEAEFDDGDFVVERSLAWIGCEDSRSRRGRFQGDKSSIFDEMQPDKLSWQYEGLGKIGKPIKPLIEVKPLGFGVMAVRDQLFGIRRKISQGVR